MGIKVFAFLFLITVAEANTGYGTFNLTIEKFEFCKGPKHKDCVVATAKLSSNTVIDYDIIVTENVTPTKGKVTTNSGNEDDSIRLNINKPCENLFTKMFLQSVFNASSKCTIQKGHYKIHLDYLDLMQNYYGGMHLYGTRVFKAVFYGNECNFMCTFIKMHLTPNS